MKRITVTTRRGSQLFGNKRHFTAEQRAQKSKKFPHTQFAAEFDFVKK